MASSSDRSLTQNEAETCRVVALECGSSHTLALMSESIYDLPLAIKHNSFASCLACILRNKTLHKLSDMLFIKVRINIYEHEIERIAALVLKSL